ncbi:PIN domain-containing protein [Candidatus Nitrosotenuis sp. DW1]|uniref:PIN domain-containing protein n=1 Tax=Candidatus Nitrosotenuis sp. DW1 TaxID=2259672 RepID=UPI0015C9777B|nr:twitching motility protein PilT [Candidatus Nitrosotenuis sp. DW1]QLH09762.1 twitching motility protein PilT [Candidatus Nitrosotenuis sp. DW1]
MVDVICDTSFLIHLATNRIKNLSTIDTEIGSIRFIVPNIVTMELKKLLDDKGKKDAIVLTLDYIKSFPTISLNGSFADAALQSYIKKQGGIVATMDKELKLIIKKLGGSILSISNNKIVLESSKV